MAERVALNHRVAGSSPARPLWVGLSGKKPIRKDLSGTRVRLPLGPPHKGFARRKTDHLAGLVGLETGYLAPFSV